MIDLEGGKIMSLEISMEDKAKKFLEKKDNILTISRMDIDRGCSGFEDLDISYHKPRSNSYEEYLHHGVTIYVQTGLSFKEGCVEIVVSGIGPFKAIAVDGLKRSV